jgi:hypothetical protein
MPPNDGKTAHSGTAPADAARRTYTDYILPDHRELPDFAAFPAGWSDWSRYAAQGEW